MPIEISLSDNLSSEIDVLRSDNKYFFSAAVTKGIKTLIVDVIPIDSNRFTWLMRALKRLLPQCPGAINGRG